MGMSESVKVYLPGKISVNISVWEYVFMAMFAAPIIFKVSNLSLCYKTTPSYQYKIRTFQYCMCVL